MEAFEYQLPTKIVFGVGRYAETGRALRGHWQKGAAALWRRLDQEERALRSCEEIPRRRWLQRCGAGRRAAKSASGACARRDRAVQTRGRGDDPCRRWRQRHRFGEGDRCRCLLRRRCLGLLHGQSTGRCGAAPWRCADDPGSWQRMLGCQRCHASGQPRQAQLPRCRSDAGVLRSLRRMCSPRCRAIRSPTRRSMSSAT